MPPDLSQCVFVIEQALSVRALQEIISSNDAEAVMLNTVALYYLLLSNIALLMHLMSNCQLTPIGQNLPKI